MIPQNNDEMVWISNEEYDDLLRKQKELNELQRLAEVVKGFIETNDLTDDFAVSQCCHNEPSKATLLVLDICEVVRYKE